MSSDSIETAFREWERLTVGDIDYVGMDWEREAFRAGVKHGSAELAAQTARIADLESRERELVAALDAQQEHEDWLVHILTPAVYEASADEIEAALTKSAELNRRAYVLRRVALTGDLRLLDDLAASPGSQERVVRCPEGLQDAPSAEQIEHGDGCEDV